MVVTLEKSLSHFPKHMKSILFAFIIVFSFSSLAQPSLPENGLAHPESIIEYHGRYFVSNIGANLDTKFDGDGFISEIDQGGNVITQKFLPAKGELHAPKGMCIIDDQLYVTDINRIVGFSLVTRKTITVIDLSKEATFLNDVVALNNTTILVTETMGGKVLKVDLTTKKVSTLPGNYPGANGLSYDKASGTVWLTTMGVNFDGSGKVFEKKLDQEQFVALPQSPAGIFDGVAPVGSTRLLISDWANLTGGAGRLLIFDSVNKSTKVLGLRVTSPADFHFSPETNLLLLPQTLKHNVVSIKLSEHASGADTLALNHFGLIKSFVGGLYGHYFPISELKRAGNFGIFAPALLNGEGFIDEHEYHQTLSTGNMRKLEADSVKVSLAFTHFFQTEYTVSMRATNKHEFEKRIDELFPGNSIVAIRVRGHFDTINTRAFPAVGASENTPLAKLMHLQKTFPLRNTDGTLVGYRIPEYLNGINIAGYHFHFLSTDGSRGGHVPDFVGEDLQIDLDLISAFRAVLPSGKAFESFNFREDRNSDIKTVESGGLKNE
jgi:alpha-acetolactate decarboxylase